MKVLVLVSGGMDSVVALHEAEAEHEVVAGLSFDYGAKHNHREIPFAKKHCDSFGIRPEVIDLRFMNTHF